MADVGFHDLRHTHVSMLIDAGLDLVTTAKRIGHKNAKVTLSTCLEIVRRSFEQSMDEWIAEGRTPEEAIAILRSLYATHSTLDVAASSRKWRSGTSGPYRRNGPTSARSQSGAKKRMKTP